MKLLSRVRLFATEWSVAYQAPQSMGFSRQEYWSGLPFPSPGDLPDPGMEPRSPLLKADSLLTELPGNRGYLLQTWKLICLFNSSGSKDHLWTRKCLFSNFLSHMTLHKLLSSWHLLAAPSQLNSTWKSYNLQSVFSAQRGTWNLPDSIYSCVSWTFIGIIHSFKNLFASK